MADSSGRTPQEREAARRAREARRDGRSGFEGAAGGFDADPPRLQEPSPNTSPEPSDEPPPEASPDPSEDRPIRSFPSPPDPAFYVPDDELETPSGTVRASRMSRGGRRGPGRRPIAGRRGAAAPSGPPGRRPPRRRRHSGGPAGAARRWLVRVLALIGLLIGAAIIWFAIELFQPFGTSTHGEVTVRIAPGTSTRAVARTLHHDGVIGSRFFFELRTSLDGDRGKIRAGTYHLRRGMSYGAVLAKLTKAPRAARTSALTLAEGHTRQYVARLLRRQHVRGNYLAVTRHSKLLNPRAYGAPRTTHTLEGFLFPDTFSLVFPARVSALVADQLTDFKRRFASVSLTAARHRHQSAFQVLTIASLIEAEAASPRDDRLVASVIENRLRDHMMLQLDSTARYATGNFTHDLTQTQLASRSPYNTHTHFGLPPGPINSPGLTAIDAAAHPAQSRYLYFFSKPCTSTTVFASNLTQFDNLLHRDYRPHCPR